MEVRTVLWREWLFFKRRFWRITASQMVSPLLYFVTFGLGVGRAVDMHGLPYLHYLIPGLLAMTTMRNSYTAVSTRISVMRLHEKSFENYLYAPVRMNWLVAGHIFAGGLRGMYAGVFILILGLLSQAGPVWNVWLLGAVAVNSFLFAALGFLAAMIMNSHYDMNHFTNIVITPMSFLCGTFFSLEEVPVAFRCLAELMPLTHTVRLIRGTFFGETGNVPAFAVALAFLLLFWKWSVWVCDRRT